MFTMTWLCIFIPNYYMLSAIWSRLLSTIDAIGYQGIAFAMFLENVFPPIPSELIMPFGGFLAGQGEMTLWWVILAGVIWTYLGVLPFYLLWFRLHKKKLLHWTERWGKYLGITVEEIERAFVAFETYGNSFVFFGRFIPIFRSVISFPAGAVRMNFRVYSAYTLLWTWVWSWLLAYAWYLLGDQRERVAGYAKEYEHILLWLIALWIILFIGWKVRKAKKLKS